jgi:F-type H+-transporting ATPase subunit a
MKLRPEGKPSSLSHIVETAVEGFHGYLLGVMGPDLARKYSPLVSSYFFTILCFNWFGLIPGMMSPTANPNIPVSLAIVAFFCVHFIAIKEAGFKSWFMHLVGEPLWLAPLNFPLHVLGEFIKPMSLSIRLLCNVFGEEMVILQLSLLAVGLFVSLHLPIPFQLPMLFLGLFFGLLQALVFSTLLAIYISILATHHDDHDEHNPHGHVEHVDDHGHDRIIAHPSETTIA